MKTLRIPLILVLAAVLAACAGLEKREQLAQAEYAYTAVVETATDMRELGLLDDETVQELTPAFIEANDLLQSAHDAIVDGDYGLADEQIAAAERMITVLSRRLRNL